MYVCVHLQIVLTLHDSVISDEIVADWVPYKPIAEKGQNCY